MAPDPTHPSLEQIARWLTLPPEDLLRRCTQAPFQGPGPGGQKRNRVYSGVRLTHAESGLTAEASERREARRNLEDALRRLRMSMALSLSPALEEQASGASARSDTEVTQKAGQSSPSPLPFRAGANPAHADFPIFAFAALHALESRGGRLSEAAASLGATASALTRFLRSEKAVWARTQAIRKRNGIHPLKSG